MRSRSLRLILRRLYERAQPALRIVERDSVRDLFRKKGALKGAFDLPKFIPQQKLPFKRRRAAHLKSRRRQRTFNQKNAQVDIRERVRLAAGDGTSDKRGGDARIGVRILHDSVAGGLNQCASVQFWARFA